MYELISAAKLSLISVLGVLLFWAAPHELRFVVRPHPGHTLSQHVIGGFTTGALYLLLD